MEQPYTHIGVVGAGAMGRGIVQLFAQAGVPVRVHDSQSGAVERALATLADTFGRLVERGKLGADAAQATLGRITKAETLADFAPCDLIIEAIVERLDAKQTLFRALEEVLAPDAVIVTNTSSLSVTAIAAACKRPERIGGYHFFNPVPLMRVVEVVGGPRTRPQVIDGLVALARAAGHVPVVCQDTPGFIVNHAGRAYGPESLKALGEGVASHADIDRILREQVQIDGQGFKLGPFELLDLTGLDVSHPVMESIYRQYYDEPRYKPSVIGAQRVAAGLLGRKTGEGFYRYSGAETVADPALAEAPAPALPQGLRAWIAPGPQHVAVRSLVEALGAALDTSAQPAPGSLVVLTPMGLDATEACRGLDASRAVALDTLMPFAVRACKRRVIMTTPATTSAWRDAAHALFAADGARVSVLRDSAGFIAQRVVAMIVSIACDIAQQRVASPSDIDTAVRIGLGYPAGPLTMGDRLGPARILEILEGMHRVTLDPRYRPSPWLRRRAQLGLSLLAAD
jgi:3-hydroxybutyryl-CoA dehydrogenase